MGKFYVDVYIMQQGGRVGIWFTMADISNHFLQISLKTHNNLVQMRFNLQLLQTKHTYQTRSTKCLEMGDDKS